MNSLLGTRDGTRGSSLGYRPPATQCVVFSGLDSGGILIWIIVAPFPPDASGLLEMAQFGVRVAQADRELPRQALHHLDGELLVVLGKRVEALARQHEQVRVGERKSVGRTQVTVEKGHFAEEVAAPERREVVALFVFQGKDNPHSAAPDQEDFMPRVTARADPLARP